MKLAVSSGAFDEAIGAGDLTQLEFIDLCARMPACDGVVLDVRHFPRTDSDYLAQLKKMATDRGLGVAALADAAAFAADDSALRARFEQATALGTPLIAAPLQAVTACSWSDQLARLSAATAIAKAANVTVALRNAAGTFAGDAREIKRVAKETDSAWLRYGPDPWALADPADAALLAANTVLLWVRTETSVEATLATFAGFKGYAVFDDPRGTADALSVTATLGVWFAALAKETPNRT